MSYAKIFYNSINRYSFHLISLIGMIMFFLPIICWKIYVGFLYNGDNIFLDVEPSLAEFITFIFPTYGVVTTLAVLIIYRKLLLKEKTLADYRIKNKFLSQNILYGLIAFVFYIFAILIFGCTLFLGIQLLFLSGSIYYLLPLSHAIPFIIYTTILWLIAKRV